MVNAIAFERNSDGDLGLADPPLGGSITRIYGYRLYRQGNTHPNHRGRGRVIAGTGRPLRGLNLTGSWSANLKGSPARHLDLEMFQQDDLVMGSGQLSSEGRRINITAAGSVGTKDLMVFVMAAGGEEVIRMELSASKTAITGVYEAFSRGCRSNRER